MCIGAGVVTNEIRSAMVFDEFLDIFVLWKISRSRIDVGCEWKSSLSINFPFGQQDHTEMDSTVFRSNKKKKFILH